MSQYTIAVVVGSLRKDSFNRKFAHALIKLAPKHLAFREVRIDDLPLYNQDDDANPAPQVKRLKTEISAAHAVLFVTPEYNRSIPGVLKNAIDHASRPYGQSVWAAKPAGVIGVSIGATGTAMAQQHLRNMLAYLDMPTLGQPEAYLNANAVLDQSTEISAGSRQFLQTWMDKFVAWVEQHAPELRPEEKQQPAAGARPNA